MANICRLGPPMGRRRLVPGSVTRWANWKPTFGLAKQEPHWRVCSIRSGCSIWNITDFYFRCKNSRRRFETPHLQAFQEPSLHLLLWGNCIMASCWDEGLGSTSRSTLLPRWCPLAPAYRQNFQGMVQTSSKLDWGRRLLNWRLLCCRRLDFLAKMIGSRWTFLWMS